MKKPITWNEAVELARNLIAKKKATQMQIAEIAVNICEIKRGGGMNNEVKTLKSFAAEIKIHYKTLHTWVWVK